MYKSNLNKISDFVKEHTGETWYLDEWCCSINEQLPPSRRLSKRELAYVFNRILKSEFIVDYKTTPIQYTFIPLNNTSLL